MSKSLYAYFKRKERGKESQVTSVLLPDPKGPLSEDVPSSAISKANKERLRFCAKTDTIKNKKKGPYLKVTPEMKATIAKYAIEKGNCAASSACIIAANYTELPEELSFIIWLMDCSRFNM